MKPIRVGLLGLGTVGQGVARILSANAAEIERRTGRAIEVTRASVRNVGKAEALELGIDITTDSASIVNDPDIDIVCEVMGGEDPALSLLKTAIENGKHVITANKALIAVHGNDLLLAAEKNNVVVAFESAVAGGVPISRLCEKGWPPTA